MSILFYNTTDPYGEFSNFYGIRENKNFKLMLDGQSWKSTEHYYQSYKFRGSQASTDSIEYADLIAETDTPTKTKALAKQKKLEGTKDKWKLQPKNPIKLNELIEKYQKNGVIIRPDWEEIKDTIMKNVITAKFTQNPKLLKLLRGTKEQQIAEHTSRDKYWGDGGDGSGLNKLGKMLMSIRDELALTTELTKFPSKVKWWSPPS